ncbi:MAG: ABC transporter substrate-binding protein [Pseudomonadota bacterium]
MLRSFLVVLALTAPAAAQDFPVTVTDDRGQSVTVAERPRNVAALSMAAADMLAALGRPILGVTSFQGAGPVYLGEASDGVLDLGEFDSPNLEILALSDADLILGMTRYHAPYADEFEDIAPFIALDLFTLEDASRNIEQMGAALGAPQDATALNIAFEQRASQLREAAPGGVTVVFLWAFGEMLFAYHDNLLPAEFLPILGATNPLGFQEGADPADAFKMMETEEILAIDPDVLIVYASHGGELQANPAFARLSAVQNGRVYEVGQQYAQATGPIARRMVLEELAHLLYPDTFAPPADLPAASRAKQIEIVP